jgi:hypothetical protein
MQEFQLDSSFRDPSGFVFSKEGKIYRHINQSYIKFYNKLMNSGLYQELVKEQYLVTHEEIKRSDKQIIIKPLQLSLILYPYEWSFSQLKAAAILTLKVQLLALRYGMSLKDATAYNIQFIGSQPVFIDTLSFEPTQDGLPWKAYGQFCRHFIAPMLLMKHVDLRCIHMLKSFLDGLPLDLVSRMLPRKTHLSLFVKLHIHLHARYLARHKYNTVSKRRMAQMSLRRLQAMLESIFRYLQKLEYVKGTEWGDYYEATLNYTSQALDMKRQIVGEYLKKIRPVSVWDVGGNDGTFSRLAKDMSQFIFSTDIDLQALDQNYRQSVKNQEKNVWPLFFDVTNPTPDLGLHAGQLSLEKRLNKIGIDCILALALIHHLSITNNYPFEFIARFFARVAPYLVIEFVKPSDSWASELLARKQDAQELFTHYNQNEFENSFGAWYAIEDQRSIEGTHRVVYLMKRK